MRRKTINKGKRGSAELRIIGFNVVKFIVLDVNQNEL